MKPKLPDEVVQAIERAKRTAGWNNRSPDVLRFRLPNRWGHEPCELSVVPACVWAYRREERQADAWHVEQRGK